MSNQLAATTCSKPLDEKPPLPSSGRDGFMANDEVRNAIKARREALENKSATPSPTPSKTPAVRKVAPTASNSKRAKEGGKEMVSSRPVISQEQLTKAIEARRSSSMGPPISREPSKVKAVGELTKSLIRKMSESEGLGGEVEKRPSLNTPLREAIAKRKPVSEGKPSGKREEDKGISGKRVGGEEEEPFAAFVVEAASAAPEMTQSVLPSPLRREIAARRRPSTAGKFAKVLPTLAV